MFLMPFFLISFSSILNTNTIAILLHLHMVTLPYIIWVTNSAVEWHWSDLSPSFNKKKKKLSISISMRSDRCFSQSKQEFWENISMSDGWSNPFSFMQTSSWNFPLDFLFLRAHLDVEKTSGEIYPQYRVEL